MKKIKWPRVMRRSIPRDRARQSGWKAVGIINKDGTPFTIKDWDTTYIRQKGKCYDCKTHQRKLERILDTDHCHACGVFRNLVCHGCNLKRG